MFSAGDLLHVSVTVWLLLSRLLHASGGLVSLGIQQTLISTSSTCSLSQIFGIRGGKNVCLNRKKNLDVIALQLLVNGVYLLVHWAAEHSKVVIQLT